MFCIFFCDRHLESGDDPVVYGRFRAFGITGKLALVEGVSLTLGVLTGTVLWWLALSAVTAHFREKVTDRIYKRLHLLLGGLMILFGSIMIVESIIR